MVVGNQLGGSSSNNDIGLRSNNLNSSFTSSLGPVTGSNASSGYLSGGNLPFAGGSVGMYMRMFCLMRLSLFCFQLKW